MPLYHTIAARGAPHVALLACHHRECFSLLPVTRASAGGPCSVRRARRLPGRAKAGAGGGGAHVRRWCRCAQPAEPSPVLVAVGARASPLAASSDLGGWNRSALAFPSPYVAYVCFNYFRRFKYMLQLFHFDVAKVD
jgi:hypothetical protein